jgi:hypothetical protein
MSVVANVLRVLRPMASMSDIFRWRLRILRYPIARQFRRHHLLHLHPRPARQSRPAPNTHPTIIRLTARPNFDRPHKYLPIFGDRSSLLPMSRRKQLPTTNDPSNPRSSFAKQPLWLEYPRHSSASWKSLYHASLFLANIDDHTTSYSKKELYDFDEIITFEGERPNRLPPLPFRLA